VGGRRAVFLLLRSAASALASLCTALAHFMHPHVEKIFLACLPVSAGPADDERGEPLASLAPDSDEALLNADIARCLVVTVSCVPARLAVPALGRVAVQLQQRCADQPAPAEMKRFVNVLEEFWGSLDRPQVAANIAPLGSLAVEILSFRWHCADQSALSLALDDAVSSACVQLCLKLTEAEVRTFLAHAVEWAQPDGAADEADEDEDEEGRGKEGSKKRKSHWREFSKSVSLFNCIAALNEKMRSIFTACMVPIWPLAVKLVGDLASYLKKKTFRLGQTDVSHSSTTAAEAPSGKKRKHKPIEEASAAKAESHDQVIAELVTLSAKLLRSIRSCCLFDNSGFINEV
jgi:hypothetical protein